MKISIKYDVVDKALHTLMPIINDKLLAEDLKNVTLHVKGDVGKLVATSTQITSAVDTDLNEVIFEEEDIVDIDADGNKEAFIQIRAKELDNILSTFKGLKRTKVTNIVFNVDETSVVMDVYEEAIDANMPNADKYKRVTKFRLVRLRIRGILLDEIKSVQNKPTESVGIPTDELDLFVNSLLPNIKNEKRDTFNTINFNEKYIYTTSSSYVAVMTNTFPIVEKDEEGNDRGLGIECMQGFRLQNSKADFLKSFLNDVDKVEFTKTAMTRGGVLLTIVKPGAIATLKCPDMSRVRDISSEISDLSELKGIEVDKIYLIDVLKRVKLSSDIINVEVDTLNRLMKLKSKTVVQELPILSNNGGEGIYKFTLKVDVVDSLIFAHSNDFDDTLKMVFRNEGNTVTLICSDRSNMWQTVIKGLPQQELKTDW